MVDRVQVPGPAIPHDISQPGNRRQEACVCGEACQTGIARMATHRAPPGEPAVPRGRSKTARPTPWRGKLASQGRGASKISMVSPEFLIPILGKLPPVIG